MTNPVFGFLNTIKLRLAGRIRFDAGAVGKKIETPDGKAFTVFRRVEVRSGDAADPEAYFLIRFKPVDMGPEENIEFSKKPMTVFMGFTGFRSKYWAVDYESGICQGMYEWRRIEDAERYSKSIAMRFMTRRSDPSSVSWRIIDRRKESFEFTISG